MLENTEGEFLHVGAEPQDAFPVANLCACLTAQPDGKHFHYAAFVLAAKCRVRFDAVERNDPVGLGGQPVDQNGAPVIKLADLFYLHGGHHRTAHVLLRNAIAMDNIQLALGRGASVASHGGNHKGLGPAHLQERNHLPDDYGKLVNSPATGRDRNRHVRLDDRNHLRPRKLAAHFGCHIFQVGGIKDLTDRHQAGNGHIFQQFMNGAHVCNLLINMDMASGTPDGKQPRH